MTWGRLGLRRRARARRAVAVGQTAQGAKASTKDVRTLFEALESAFVVEPPDPEDEVLLFDVSVALAG